jgi:hypothetical protein
MQKLLVWFLIGSLLLVLGYWLLVMGAALGLIAPHIDWRRWPAIRRARRGIREAVRQQVPDAEVFSYQGATKSNPGHLSFSIRTASDRERDLLRQDPDIHTQFRNALVRAGYPTNTIPVVHFGIESQETVDRDYGGSWDQATGMR